MKRIGNLFTAICDPDNLRLADAIAQRGKAKQPGVIAHNRDAAANLEQLRTMLLTGTYQTSAYKTFTITDPKERLIHSLPYFPDRILHHAIMNVLEPMFVANFTADTFSCIKGRGIHAGVRAVKAALKDEAGTRYCLKLDIRKFYPSINHGVLKAQLRRKIKDPQLLDLLDGIIDSAPGLPIGNYLSQFLANFYLSGLDHYIKQALRIRYYFRYADDLVLLSGDKDRLHQALRLIRCYLKGLRLQVKGNYQVFPVDARGIDFLGYRFYHTHSLLRKRIKKSLAREATTLRRPQSLASYAGWAKHCNARNLLKKLPL